jgi:predicted nucleic acid-binding protein
MLQQMLAVKSVSVLYADATTTLFYARIFADLRRNGTPIPTNDLWIAALAMQHGLPVFSFDRHFQNVQSIATVS